MALISNTLFKSLEDRIATQASMLKQTINSGTSGPGGNKYYPRIHNSASIDGDYDLENALIDSANAIDQNTISGSLFKSVYSSFVQSLSTHVTDHRAASFDSYMNISGLNIHPDAEDVFYQSTGQHLDAVNVFFTSPNVLVASYFPTGSGTGVFAGGTAIGTGSGKVSLTNHAAAKFVLVPIGNTTAATQINLRLLREDGGSTGSTASFDNILVGNGVASGTQFAVKNWDLSGVGLSNTFLDCNNIVAAGGASGNGFRVYALMERSISL